jgi:hypothetical protein
MLAHIYETLEMRVGMKLAEQMSNEQLDEFESYINRQDEAGALKWLESNFPNYKQVVAEELDKLKAEISQVAPQIVAQAQSNAAPQSASNPAEQQQVQQPQQPMMQPQPAPPQPSLQPQQPSATPPTTPVQPQPQAQPTNPVDQPYQPPQNPQQTPPPPMPQQPWRPE